jgi:hypothetical protein
MNKPSYIQENTDELFENAPPYIQDLILNGEVDTVTIALSKTYNIITESQAAFCDLITYILIKALQPDDVVQALQDLVNVTPDVAISIATDLEHGILEKADISLLKKKENPIATLEFQGEKSKEDLRTALLDTTKRESALTKSPLPAGVKKAPVVLNPGSRSQLLEQLNVLGTIPNDEEITTRLSHIQAQISALKKQEEDNSLDSKIALKSFMFGEKGKVTADSNVTKLTYSVPPTRYTVDPYREVD